MKKITLLIAIFLSFVIQGNAQLLTQDFNTALTWTVGHPTGTSTNAGWTRQTTGGNPTATPFGAGMARFNSFSINVENAYDLNSPAIAFAGGSYRVTFKMFRENSYIDPLLLDKISVYYNTTATSVGGTLLGTVNRPTIAEPIVTANGWYTYSFNIPGNPTGPGYISFLATTAYGSNIFIDDISVEVQPTCLPPTALTSTVSTHSATVSFTGSISAPANGYEYELRTSGAAGSGATGLVVSGADAQLSHVLNTLTPNTAYTYYVRAICSGTDSSAWESRTFTTLAIAPANDNCFDAVSLTINSDLACTTTVDGTLLGATASGEGSTSVGTPDDDVWYKFIATGTAHRIVLSSVTPATDLVHEVLAGDCGGGLYNIAISDPDTSNLTGLTVGTTYYVRVFSKAAASNATTTFKICVGTPPPPPANDECSGAVLLTPSANTTCASPTAGTTNAATQSLAGCVGTADDDVWYKFVATSTAHTIIITNVSGATDIVTEVFDSCGGTSLKCQDTPNSPIIIGGLTIGNTYSFRIYTYSSTSSDRTTFTVCVVTPPPPPANDNCSGAVLLTPSSDLTCASPTAGTTDAATQSLVGCAGTADDDVWYKFVATATAHTIITTNVSGVTDIVTQAFDSCGGTSLVCQDTPNSPVALTNLTVGNTYFFRIYTYSSTTTDRTTFTVCVGTPPPPPANDLIANAAVLTESATSSCSNALAGTTVSATHSAEYACSTTDVDVWYTFTPATTGVYYFQRAVVSGTGNGYISVYSGTPAALTRLNTSCSVNNFTQALTAGTQYYVSVSSTAITPLSFALCVFPAPAAPANDLIANATVLTESTDSACGNAVSGTTMSATHSAEYACSATDVDVWYTFTPSTTTNYIFRRSVVTGTGNGYISVYSGTPAALTRLNSSCTATTFVQALTAGTTYYVSVSSTATSSLGFALCVYPSPPPPVNDNCDAAITLTVNPDLSCAVVTAGTNAFATTSPQPTTSLSGTATQDVWFKFVATATVHKISLTNIVAVIGTSTDMGIGLYDGTAGCDALVFKSTSDPESYDASGLVAGTTYYVRVYGWGATTLAQTNFNVCIGTLPPPPSNDNCATATPLVPGALFTSNPIVGTTALATTTSGLTPSCQATSANEVWYSVVVPASGSINIETKAVSGSALTDTVLSLFSGTCQALVEIECDDDDGDGNFSLINLTGQTPGATIYIGVWRYSNSAANTGQFQVSAYHSSLSTVAFDNTSFKAYPNPVKDILKLSYSQEMTNVSVFNLLGQQVINKSLNTAEAQVDMSNLAAGTYLVKVNVDNQVKTIKVVKE